MTTSQRQQQHYDHRLRDLVHNTGDLTIATDLGVPRSTARGWLRKAPAVVVSLEGTNLRTSELQREIDALLRRVRKLRALLRLALALLRSSGLILANERLPMAATKHGSSEPWIVPGTLCRYGHFCGSCDCPQVASIGGDGCRTRVR